MLNLRNIFSFYPHNALLAQYMLWPYVYLSVRVTSRHCTTVHWRRDARCH